MAEINGKYRHGTRPLVTFDAMQEGEKWTVTVRAGVQRLEAATWAPSPWRMIEQLIAEALDGASRDAESPRWDMNRKLAKPLTPTIPLRRRGKIAPGDLPEWKPPETA